MLRAMARLYEDSGLICDEDGITIRTYYFPFGDKRIHWDEVKSIEEFPMRGPFGGRWRIWGSGDFRHWFPLDTNRPSKSVGFVIDKGTFSRAVVTPDDPNGFRAALEGRGMTVKKTKYKD